MKESETIIGYSNMLVGITNKVKLLDTIFADSRIAEKILVTVPKRYEASISTLETTNELSKISSTEVIHALHAQDQRRLMREESKVKGVLPAKHQNANKYKKNKNLDGMGASSASTNAKGNWKKSYLP
ncbi:hypothetical protein GmHk_07G019148 [Glycine max]|nr:hypothetical protein GmHk_07G019148 [Glycine max]